ncbi:hypothetical protein F0U59_22970 [Archangium gephyra]|nr:hypothetical protein F0U59_22970 [Archangium gephyra]
MFFSWRVNSNFSKRSTCSAVRTSSSRCSSSTVTEGLKARAGSSPSTRWDAVERAQAASARDTHSNNIVRIMSSIMPSIAP